MISRRISARALDAVQRLGILGFFARIPFWLMDRFLENVRSWVDRGFDRRFGTDTCGIVALDSLDIISNNKPEGIWYQATSPSVFHRALRQLRIDYRHFIFIDFGSGKGRCLLLAAQYQFSRVIGVEFARELHEIAQRNIAAFPGTLKRCDDVRSICTDVLDYQLPLEPMLCFFFSPFKPPLLEQVLASIDASLALVPREAVLVFYGSNRDSIALLTRPGWNVEKIPIPRDWTLPRDQPDRHTLMICRHLPTVR